MINFPTVLSRSELQKFEGLEPIAEMKKELNEYIRVGMEKKAKDLKMQMQLCLEANALASIGMKLLYFFDTSVTFMNKSGEVQSVCLDGSLHDEGRFRLQKLSRYTGDIPEEILNKLPAGAGKKAYVFSKSMDPIIAIKLFYGKYVAIHWWE